MTLPGDIWSIKIRHNDDVYYLMVRPSTTSLELRRHLSQITHLKVHDMRLHIPRYGNHKFDDRHTLEQSRFADGEELTVVYRDPETKAFEKFNRGQFPGLEEPTL
jgi:hypothetical protein